jgi:hypothetical protein
MSKSDLLGTGIQFSEKANERVVFHNALLSSPRQLGRGRSTSYSIVLDSQHFGLGFGPRDVTLKPSSNAVGPRSRFKVKVRIIAVDANGNTTTKFRTVQVGQ